VIELIPSTLFAEIRERLGQSLADSLDESLPKLAAVLEHAAAAPADAMARSALAVAAAALYDECALRAQRARTRLFELSFRVLETNQGRPERAQPPLVRFAPSDSEVDRLVRALASGLEEALERRYPSWWRRLDALLSVPTPPQCAPLGSQVLALSVLEALRPGLERLAGRLEVRNWLFDQWLPDWVASLGDIDAALAAYAVATIPSLPAPEAAAAEAMPAVDHQLPVEPLGVSPSEAGQERPTDQPTADVPTAAPAEPTEIQALLETMAGEEGAADGAAQRLIAGARIAAGLGPESACVAPTQAASRLTAALPRPEAIDRDAVAFAHRHGVTPYARAARQLYFAGLRTRMVAGPAPAGAVAALDLIAAMFDYAVDDERMPAAALPLMWRLQWPVAALAALDVGFLGDDRRSVRRLVESIAAIAIACAEDVVQGSELYRRLETVVRAVEVVANAFQVRATVLDEQVQREYSRASQGLSQLLSRVAREKQAMEAMPGRRNRRDFTRRPSPEREKDVTQRIKDRLRERFGDRDWPESVRQFLMSVWLRHLRSAALRDGEQSAAFQVALQVVDDLLWSVDEAGTTPRRSELANRIPQLIKLLMQGVGESGAKPEEFRPFLDELFLIHLRRMQRPVHQGDLAVDTQGHPGEEAPSAQEQDVTLPGSSPSHPSPDGEVMPPVLNEALPSGVEEAHPLNLAEASQAMMADLASHLELPTQPTAAPGALPAVPAQGGASAVRPEGERPDADQRLLTVLGSLDLNDFPVRPQRVVIDPDEAMARLARGSWVEMTGRNGQQYEAKVAWVNPRRTVVLMVRRNDGRAVSVRASELRERFAANRAVLIQST
jgi:hypothetical protein